MAKPGVEPPDEVLVVASILGDLDAFDELASRYRAAVVRTAQAIVGREDAEDVAQDALLLAFKALPSIEEPPKFAAWLSAITRHRALRFSKRERSHQAGRIDLDEFLLEKVQALGHPVVARPEGDDELKLALEADEQRRIVAENQTLPQLDAAAGYRWNGLEGDTPRGHVSTGKGQTRVTEMNQQVLANLDKMIGEIENDEEPEAIDAG